MDVLDSNVGHTVAGSKPLEGLETVLMFAGKGMWSWDCFC